MLFFIEHPLQDAELTRSGERRTISKRMLYVEIDATGVARHIHYAPYLDYRPLTMANQRLTKFGEARERVAPVRLEQQALDYAIERLYRSIWPRYAIARLNYWTRRKQR